MPKMRRGHQYQAFLRPTVDQQRRRMKWLPATAPITPPEVGVVTPEEEALEFEKQNYGYVNGPWFDQRRQNYFNGGYTQNFNQWNGNNFGHIGTVFGGGYRGRRLQLGEVEEEEQIAARGVNAGNPDSTDEEKQNYGYVNGPWYDQRQQNYFNGGFTQNHNTWNGHNFGNIHTVFGGRGRRLQNYGYVAGPYVPGATARFFNGGVSSSTDAWRGQNFGMIGDNTVPPGAAESVDPVTGQRTGVVSETVEVPPPTAGVADPPAESVPEPEPAAPEAEAPASPTPAVPEAEAPASPTPAVPEAEALLPLPLLCLKLKRLLPLAMVQSLYWQHVTDSTGVTHRHPIGQFPVVPGTVPGGSGVNTGVHQGAFVQRGAETVFGGGVSPGSSTTFNGNFYGSASTMFGPGGVFGGRRLQSDPQTQTQTENENERSQAGVVTPEEEALEFEKQNYGYVNGPWFDQRRQNYFNGGYTQNFNQWNGNNFGHIGSVFGGGYRGRRLQGEVEEEEQIAARGVNAGNPDSTDEEKQNYGYVNGPWYDQRQQNYFSGGFTQNHNTWNGHNFGNIHTVFGGRGRRLLGRARQQQQQN
uniref:Uncharacterized protein n=1 Tax=Chromera velia CCMP2878 TaxID=1169474 RepID=A0A0G4GR44_9ALVE|eukprot:Cvel_22963.t1-p1 / transcript=Cvel_22963.t1 / gene=Cvel_22963 / organism=Chromera_velia_CCMP2878 / gene_product=hypothetical protein / transcript_product=hypothetical protein / location=Cvel_scaffold2314:3781-6486(-) / protein_length=582 / sequence_SO=supercontig / SO=protein_coding / is_pseudo=false